MEKRTYELVVLLHPDLEIDVEAPIKKIERIITEAGGRIAKRDNWGKKRLAYSIKHQDFAIYLYFEVEVEGSQIAPIEAVLLITDEVLRHLLVVHEVGSAKPQTKAASRSAEPVAVAAEETK